jgi:opacity protein-like surface antigen
MRKTLIVIAALFLLSPIGAVAQEAHVVFLGNQHYGRYSAGLSHTFGYMGTDRTGKTVFVGCDGTERSLAPPASFQKLVRPCPQGDGGGALPVIFANSFVINDIEHQTTHMQVFDVAGGADTALIAKKFTFSSPAELSRKLGTTSLTFSDNLGSPGGLTNRDFHNPLLNGHDLDPRGGLDIKGDETKGGGIK